MLTITISFDRLTPSLIFTMLLWNNILPLFITGPQKMSLRYYGKDTWRTGCDKYWWSNIMYINNFYPTSFNDSVSENYFQKYKNHKIDGISCFFFKQLLFLLSWNLGSHCVVSFYYFTYFISLIWQWNIFYFLLISLSVLFGCGIWLMICSFIYFPLCYWFQWSGEFQIMLLK